MDIHNFFKLIPNLLSTIHQLFITEIFESLPSIHVYQLKENNLFLLFKAKVKFK